MESLHVQSDRACLEGRNQGTGGTKEMGREISVGPLLKFADAVLVHATFWCTAELPADGSGCTEDQRA